MSLVCWLIRAIPGCIHLYFRLLIASNQFLSINLGLLFLLRTFRLKWTFQLHDHNEYYMEQRAQYRYCQVLLSPGSHGVYSRTLCSFVGCQVRRIVYYHGKGWD
ncbi:hypothetical protein BDV11DRAFT_138021 [Aspergillus similis]